MQEKSPEGRVRAIWKKVFEEACLVGEEEPGGKAEEMTEDIGSSASGAAAESGALLAGSADGKDIRDLIYTVRGMQVMLDSDLAMLYGVETKALNRAAKRNEGRFPKDFRFQLTSEEYGFLRCQIGTSCNDLEVFGSGGRRYMPYVFTEQGVAMLSAVLRSKVAIDTSVRVIRAFVEMRHFIADNAALFEQIRAVELRQLEYQKATDERFERVFDYMDAREAPRQKVFFDGQIYDAFELLVSLVQRAEESIVLIDGYVDVQTLNILAKKVPGAAVTIWTHPHTKLSQLDVDRFNEQYPRLEVKRTTAFHDRFLVLDGAEGYIVGASIKDAGKRGFAVTRIEDVETITGVMSRLEEDENSDAATSRRSTCAAQHAIPANP